MSSTMTVLTPTSRRGLCLSTPCATGGRTGVRRARSPRTSPRPRRSSCPSHARSATCIGLRLSP
eukprot:7071829-Prymnesium_polylepis.1